MKKWLVIFSLFLASCASSNKHKEVTHTKIDSIAHTVVDSSVGRKDISIDKNLAIYGIDEEIDDSVTTITKDSTGNTTTIKHKTTIKRHIDSAKHNTTIEKHDDTFHVKTTVDTKLNKTEDKKVKTVTHKGVSFGLTIPIAILLLLLIAGYFIAKKLNWLPNGESNKTNPS
jgi:hypothetical protein